MEFFPKVDINEIDSCLDDFDMLANKWHDPDYYEGNKWYLKVLADYRFAKAGFKLLSWSHWWIQVLFFLIAFIWLTLEGWDAYNRWKKKSIRDLLNNNKKDV